MDEWISVEDFGLLRFSEFGVSLAVQWLRFHTSNARGMGSIPVRGTKILHAVLQKVKIKKVYNLKSFE